MTPELKSNIGHAIIALVAQFVTVLICYMLQWIPLQYFSLYFAVGMLPGIFFYIGRELTQMEVRLQRGEPRWTKDATMDLVFPVSAVSIVAIVAQFFK